MLITCLTCKTNVNLLTLDETDINILDYLFHPHTTSYLEHLKDNETAQICEACREKIRDIDKFRDSALNNFLQCAQVWEVKPSLRTSSPPSITSQQDVMVEIQSPSLDSTVFVKTEQSELETDEFIIKPDLDGGKEEEPPSDLSKMMLANILKGMYVAKATPTTTTVPEIDEAKPSSSQLETVKMNVTTIAQPLKNIVQRATTSLGNKSVHDKKKSSDLVYRNSYDAHRAMFKCSECSKPLFRKKRKGRTEKCIRIQRLATMWELARQPPPTDHEFYPKVVQLVHKHYTDGWKNWVINDLPYEELFGKTIDTELEKKIRFLLPSVDLMRAWKPQATHASEQAVRDIRRKLLKWPFGRSLIYAPKDISVKIHDNSYLFVSEVLMKLKPFILSRKALSEALKEDSKQVSIERDKCIMPSASGEKRAGEGSPEQLKKKRNGKSDELPE